MERTHQLPVAVESETEPQRRKQRGQGFTEYIILVGIIAILLIGAVTAFKDQLGATYDKATNKVKTDIHDKIQ